MPRKPSNKPSVSLTKKDKNPKGGLTQAGRDKYNKATGGNLKPPVSKEEAKKSPTAAKRRKSFCARSEGQAKKFPKAAKNPESRLNKARDKWDC